MPGTIQWGRGSGRGAPPDVYLQFGDDIEGGPVDPDPNKRPTAIIGATILFLIGGLFLYAIAAAIKIRFWGY